MTKLDALSQCSNEEPWPLELLRDGKALAARNIIFLNEIIASRKICFFP